MGTNYYLHRPLRPELHIGKSSGGWVFSLHVHDNGPQSLKDWERLFKRPFNHIFDEYHREISRKEMLSIITERRWERQDYRVPHGYKSWSDFHNCNHSEDGPYDLLRHKIDGSHCIGHGEGTWDLIIGDFF